MADKIPLKWLFSGSDILAPSEYDTGDTTGVAHGGTGLSTIASDQLLYTSALDTLAATSLTAFGRSLIDDADAAASRTTLGLGTAAVKNTGTSGDTVPLNNTANAWSQIQDFSAAGIYIGGATADNLLTQYDSNLNWTPVVTVDTTGDLSIAYGVQVGRARQIGNRVDFNLRLTMTTFIYTTASGALHVSLPATSEGTANNTSMLSCAIGGWVAPANYSNPEAQIPSGSSVIDLKRQGNNGGIIANLDISEIPSGTSPVIMHIAGSYEV